MTRLQALALAFLFFAGVFLVTHLLKFPGSLAYLMELTHNQPILDLKASFSSAETYARLDAFGESGRSAYLRTMMTIDTIFPIAAFLFLFLLAKYAAEVVGLAAWQARALESLSIGYGILDFLENATVVLLLINYPEQMEFLAANIGFLTVGKRTCMLGALLLPLSLITLNRIAFVGAPKPR